MTRRATTFYVVDRQGGTNVVVADGTTGAQTGTLDTTGISGGVFLLNAVAVADDGAIYAANLRTNTDQASFKIYRWADVSAMPTVVYDGVPGPGLRLGDTLAATGSGAGTVLLAGANDGNGAGASPGDNSFAYFTTADGSTFSATVPTLTGTDTGDFRLGIDFYEEDDQVLGRSSGDQDLRLAEVDGATATLLATAQLNAAGETFFDYDPETNLLVTGAFTNSDVRLYELGDLANPDFQDLANLVGAGSVSNPNGSGDAFVGRAADGSLRAYVLNTNNGIQAFTVIPEPASLGLVAAAGLGLIPPPPLNRPRPPRAGTHPPPAVGVPARFVFAFIFRVRRFPFPDTAEPRTEPMSRHLLLAVAAASAAALSTATALAPAGAQPARQLRRRRRLPRARRRELPLDRQPPARPGVRRRHE